MEQDRQIAAEREHLEGSLSRFGPFHRVPFALPPGGPPRVYASDRAVALFYSAARVRREAGGIAQLAGCAAQPTLLAADERALVLGAVDEVVEDPLAAVRALRPDEVRFEARTRRAALEELSHDVAIPRALSRLGLPRKRLDRWLEEPVAVETRVGPSFGGLAPGWWWSMGGRAVGLRCERARARAWFALDLAGLALDLGGIDLDVLRRVHAEGSRDPAAADRAFDLASIALFVRELVVGGDERFAARARDLIEAVPGVEPAEVRVWLEGPSFVDTAIWHRSGALASAGRARWLRTNLDGLSVGGGRLSVRTEPPVRKGTRAPVREPRGERRRRLFSRWDEGIQTDDEGLYSATPEALAMRIAEGARGVVLDGTCGIGALTIAYARQPGVQRVLAVDLDARRVEMTRANAALYGVASKIEATSGDVFDVVAARPHDLLVLDPPWGGRDYDRRRMVLGDLTMDLAALLERVSTPVVLKLPRSFDVATLPGRWTVEAIVDERGILKLLVARRRAASDAA